MAPSDFSDQDDPAVLIQKKKQKPKKKKKKPKKAKKDVKASFNIDAPDFQPTLLPLATNLVK